MRTTAILCGLLGLLLTSCAGTIDRRGKIRVIDRSAEDLDDVRREREAKRSGAVAGNEGKVGAILGADYVLKGVIQDRVRGRVQGVGFRWFTASAARALQLCGHVRNEPDGAVRGEVEGLATSVADFLAQVSIGPKLAKVDEVVVQPIVACGGETFTIEQ